MRLAVASQTSIEKNVSLPEWLHRPIILPDELAEGYVGHVAAANGFSTASELISTLAIQDLRIPHAPIVRTLANIADMELREFICQHTMTPLTRAFTQGEARVHPHGNGDENHLRHGTMRLPRRKAALCPNCIAEDLGFWGRSYWRRHHQFPGCDWCAKHGTPLLLCHQEFFQSEPAVSQANALPSSHLDLKQARPIQARYMDIASAIMERTEPFPWLAFRKVTLCKAQELGLRSAQNGKRPLISDVVAQELPKSWTLGVIPDFEKKTQGVFHETLDGVTRCGQGRSQSASILGLAVLFDDPDIAINQLVTKQKEIASLNDHDKNKGALLPSGHWRSIEVRELFVQTRGDLSAIAKRYGVTTRHVCNCLKAQGYPSKRTIENVWLKLAAQDFFQGLNIADACKKNNILVTEFEAFLRSDVTTTLEIWRESSSHS